MTFTKQAHTTKWIPVKDLSVVWAKAQRPLKQFHVDNIANDLDPDMFDDLIVTLPNGKGIYHVVDGQHRRAAIQKLFGNDEEVPCRIVDAADPARAADIFARVNSTRRPPLPIEKFLVGVTAGYKVETEIDTMVRQLGLRIQNQTAPGKIKAVQALRAVYTKYSGDTLKDTLMTIKAIWGEDQNAYTGPIIQGFGAFIAEFGKHPDQKHFWSRLRERVAKSGSPGALVGRARTIKETMGGTMASAFKQQLVVIYNTGLRKGKLEEK